MPGRKYSPLLLALCVGAAGIGSAAVAQEDFFDLPPEHLSKLKVTAASAFAETALDSSASVSVVSRADWERRGARNLPDAVMHLPGVMLMQPPAGGRLIQVRSYDSTALRGRATMVDGVPINTFAFGSEVFSNAELQLPVLDNLELVRGPSSILYGSDAFHSALLLSTYRNAAREFTLGGEVGRDSYRQLSMRATQPLADRHSLQVALAGAHQGDQDFEYEYSAIGGGSGSEKRSGRYDAFTGLLRWEGASGSVGYHLQLFVDKTDAEEFPGGGTLTGDTRNLDIADRNAELWMVKGQIGAPLGNGWSWSVDSYYWENDYGQSYYLPTSAAATLFFEDRQQFLEHRYGLRGRFMNSDLLAGSTQLALSAGHEKAGVKDHENQRSLLNGMALPAPPADYNDLDQTIDSLSVEGKTRLGDGKFQLLYGGRFDDYSTFGGEFSPRVGAIWLPTPDMSVRAQYGSAFRAPNANELRGTNFVSGSDGLDAETLNTYELALALSQGRWQLELVGFNSRWEDRILLVQDPAAALGRRYTNAGESEARGVEMSAQYRHQQWRVELTGAYIENTNLDTDRDSSEFPNWMLGVGVGYRWPAQRLELFWSNRLHESVNVGDQAVASMRLEETGTFFRSDLTLRKQWGKRIETQLTLRNLFDRENIWPSIVNSRGGIEDIERQFAVEVIYRGLP